MTRVEQEKTIGEKSTEELVNRLVERTSVPENASNIFENPGCSGIIFLNKTKQSDRKALIKEIPAIEGTDQDIDLLVMYVKHQSQLALQRRWHEGYRRSNPNLKTSVAKLNSRILVTQQANDELLLAIIHKLVMKNQHLTPAIKTIEDHYREKAEKTQSTS